jgi:hypothetical protein
MLRQSKPLESPATSWVLSDILAPLTMSPSEPCRQNTPTPDEFIGKLFPKLEQL